MTKRKTGRAVGGGRDFFLRGGKVAETENAMTGHMGESGHSDQYGFCSSTVTN